MVCCSLQVRLRLVAAHPPSHSNTPVIAFPSQLPSSEANELSGCVAYHRAGSCFWSHFLVCVSSCLNQDCESEQRFTFLEGLLQLAAVARFVPHRFASCYLAQFFNPLVLASRFALLAAGGSPSWQTLSLVFGGAALTHPITIIPVPNSLVTVSPAVLTARKSIAELLACWMFGVFLATVVGHLFEIPVLFLARIVD